jgi:hypothetical protein
MPTSVTEYLAIDKKKFNKTGALDAALDVDTKLFIDPHLLESTQAPQLRGSYDRVKSYFRRIIKLLATSAKTGDKFWREARRSLHFREKNVRGLGIGYSRTDTSGSGIGNQLQEHLLSTAKEIVDAGIRDPEIFELVGLIEEGIGADRISDMIANVILGDLLEYSQDVFKRCGVAAAKLAAVNFNSKTLRVPINPYNDQPIVLVPKDILRDLPIAHSWDDIDRVVAINQSVRKFLNQVIGRSWKRATIGMRKQALRQLILRDPNFLRRILSEYRKKPPVQYDYASDPAGQINWLEASHHFASSFPLALTLPPSPSPQDVHDVVIMICKQFKELIEDKGLAIVLYKGRNGGPQHEEVAQKTFYGTAESYCKANNLDLSPEANAGRGPVDFKLSAGYSSRVLVEVKLSTNSRLIDGFEKQTRAYQTAEKAEYAVYLVIDVGGSPQRLKRLQRVATEAAGKGERVPDLIVVDGRLKPSASRV